MFHEQGSCVEDGGDARVLGGCGRTVGCGSEVLTRVRDQLEASLLRRLAPKPPGRTRSGRLHAFRARNRLPDRERLRRPGSAEFLLTTSGTPAARYNSARAALCARSRLQARVRRQERYRVLDPAYSDTRGGRFRSRVLGQVDRVDMRLPVGRCNAIMRGSPGRVPLLKLSSSCS
jgi:hypothetical protein